MIMNLDLFINIYFWANIIYSLQIKVLGSSLLIRLTVYTLWIKALALLFLCFFL